MRTETNVLIQLGVLMATVVLRVAGVHAGAPSGPDAGYVTLAFFVTLVGPAATVLPFILAVATVKRQRHEGYVTKAFMAAAVAMLLASGLYPETQYPRTFLPLVALIEGAGSRVDEGIAFAAGDVIVLAGIGAMTWLIAAVHTARRRREEAWAAHHAAIWWGPPRIR